MTFRSRSVPLFAGTFRYIFRYSSFGTYPRFELRFRSMCGMELETRRISGSFSEAARVFAVFFRSTNVFRHFP